MFIKALKGKIHRAKVTRTIIDYPGSLGVDADILRAANIRPYEHVLVVNVNNGVRVETYVIESPAGSREVVVLGAAARNFKAGDIAIIMNFAYYSPQELEGHKPRIVVCDQDNRITVLDK